MTLVAERIRHDYRPRGTARDIFSCREPEVLVSGPAGTGKSRACLEKILMACLQTAGIRCLIVRKTATSLTSSVLVEWREQVAKESIAYGDCKYYGGSAQEPAQYIFTNGSVVIVAGMDRSTRVLSTQYDIIYVNESTELTETDWETLSSRLRNGKLTFQQLLADCNPDSEYHWLKKRCDTGRTKMLYSRHEDNPRLYGEDGQLTDAGSGYMARLDNLTGVRYKRLRLGLWVSAEGIIYDNWDESVHVVDRMPDGWDTWTRYWSVDFGYTNPFVLQCWAEDPDGRLYMYREIYHTQRTVDEHAEAILRHVTPDGKVWTEPRPRAIICDHDAEGRATFSKAVGQGTVAANKKVTIGIEKVRERLDRASDTRPRLYILAGARVERDHSLDDAKRPTCTAEELPGYVWDNRDGKPPKEQPVKDNDHGCDAIRYMVAYRDLQGSGRVRSVKVW